MTGVAGGDAESPIDRLLAGLPPFLLLVLNRAIAALQAGIATLEDELAECRADTDRIEWQIAEADYAAETLVAHFAAIVADLGLVQLPFRLRIEIEELCQQLGIPRPWVAPRPQS